MKDYHSAEVTKKSPCEKCSEMVVHDRVSLCCLVVLARRWSVLRRRLQLINDVWCWPLRMYQSSSGRRNSKLAYGLLLSRISFTLQMWSTIDESRLVRFTRECADAIQTTAPVVCVTTYSMIAFTGRRTNMAAKMMQWLTSMEWGLILLDG